MRKCKQLAKPPPLPRLPPRCLIEKDTEAPARRAACEFHCLIIADTVAYARHYGQRNGGWRLARYADDNAPRARTRVPKGSFIFARNCAADEGAVLWNRLAGAGFKSPSAAVVKIHSGEHEKEKARHEPGQTHDRNLNANEPLMKC